MQLQVFTDIGKTILTLSVLLNNFNVYKLTQEIQNLTEQLTSIIIQHTDQALP